VRKKRARVRSSALALVLQDSGLLAGIGNAVADSPNSEAGIPVARRVSARPLTVPASMKALEAQFGRVWDTKQLADEFEVVGFLAPFVVVRRKADGVKGSLEFQHNPRHYFNFIADTK
jgi:hypothetical protein